MLELKSTISQVLRSFKVIESDSKEDLLFTDHFVLESVNALKVKVGLRYVPKIYTRKTDIYLIILLRYEICQSVYHLLL